VSAGATAGDEKAAHAGTSGENLKGQNPNANTSGEKSKRQHPNAKEIPKFKARRAQGASPRQNFQIGVSLAFGPLEFGICFLMPPPPVKNPNANIQTPKKSKASMPNH
jgi:hypothetical protein